MLGAWTWAWVGHGAWGVTLKTGAWPHMTCDKFLRLEKSTRVRDEVARRPNVLHVSSRLWPENCPTYPGALRLAAHCVVQGAAGGGGVVGGVHVQSDHPILVLALLCSALSVLLAVK